VGEILHNYGQIRQVQLMVSVAYDADLNRAFATIHEVLQANPRVLKDPAPVVGVAVLGARRSAVRHAGPGIHADGHARVAEHGIPRTRHRHRGAAARGADVGQGRLSGDSPLFAGKVDNSSLGGAP